MKAIKGFGTDMKCRDFQYEEGKTYEEKRAKLCKEGFHACQRPLDVFGYYAPGQSVYHDVELDGVVSERDSDSNVCGKKIRIGARLSIGDLIRLQTEYVKEHTTMEHTDPKAATAGDYGAATAGDYGAATAGFSGAATAGFRGAATAGNYGAATSRGRTATGKNGLSVARGEKVRVKGGIGAVLVIVEELEDSFDIKEWKAVVVDGENIKADTWYKLENGEMVVAEDA